MSKHLRLCEWSRSAHHGLDRETRLHIDAVTEAWRLLNCLPTSPISFAGPDGSQLCSKQYVGVIEVEDVLIEIYPKLDSHVISASDGQQISQAETETVMKNLMWMMEVAQHRDLVETATAHVQEAPTSFFDVFAYLLGKNLLPQLKSGISHAYLSFEDDLRTVRGRMRLAQQLTRNWNRFDRLACAWDEFTPDTPMNRLFKSACDFLSRRISYSEASRLLVDCSTLLNDVTAVSADTALREINNFRFDRSIVRFNATFDLAKRLLAGTGHNLGIGGTNTFVFLLDMNQVFEDYVHAVLESHFEVAVEEQKNIGKLLRLGVGGISQQADYYWQYRGDIWIGDAKYKHLTKDYHRPLRFRDLNEPEDERFKDAPLAGHLLSPDDIRQVTVYAELVRAQEFLSSPPNLMLLYPFVGDVAISLADSATTWNGSTLWLVPVQVTRQDPLSCAIQLSPGDVVPANTPVAQNTLSNVK